MECSPTIRTDTRFELMQVTGRSQTVAVEEDGYMAMPEAYEALRDMIVGAVCAAVEHADAFLFSLSAGIIESPYEQPDSSPGAVLPDVSTKEIMNGLTASVYSQTHSNLHRMIELLLMADFAVEGKHPLLKAASDAFDLSAAVPGSIQIPDHVRPSVVTGNRVICQVDTLRCA